MGSRYLVTIISGTDEGYSIAIRGNSIVITLRDPRDHYQNWIKDDRHGKTKRDACGQSAFALINEATEQAMTLGSSWSRCLLPKVCDPDHPEESTLWTSENIDQGQGDDSLHIRWVDEISLIFSVEKIHFHDGAVVHLSSEDRNRDQSWKIVRQELPVQNYPYTSISMYLSRLTVTISCRIRKGYNLTICNDAVMLAPSNLGDKKQHWIKETTYARHARDADKKRAFALVNKATGQAIKHGLGFCHLVRLVPFNPYHLDESILWTESNVLASGFRHIRMINNVELAFDVLLGNEGWVLVGLYWTIDDSKNQHWKIEELK